MTVYEGLTMGFVLVGVIFIIIGYAVGKTRQQVNEDEAAMEDEAFRKQINLVNEKVLELNDYHDFVKEEIEKKHKELLFLYQMIGEKEKRIKEIQLEIEHLIQSNPQPVEVSEAADMVKVRNFNRRIIALKEQGYEAKEIAKILDIGQGEVQLVLNLFE